MSVKSSLVKIAIELTPDFLVRWAANLILKGIAELSDFIFDLDSRTAFVQLTLAGEVEAIELWVDGFAIVEHHGGYAFILHKAESNRLWMNNILRRVVGKRWKIPQLEGHQKQVELLAELLMENRL